MTVKTSQPADVILATLAVVGLLAHLPLLMLHADNLWHQRPHYQFFPLVMSAVILLLAQRWPQQLPSVSRREFWLGCLLLSMGLTLLTAAVVLFSPSLAMLAFVVSGAGVLQLATGPDFLRSFLPVWSLMLLIVPPPMKLDLEFILALQSATSAAASSLLYSLEVPHVATGNVFRLPGQELFVAEACSGIHSQLALVVTSLIVAVMLRRSFIHTSLLAASAIFWSFAMNVIRVSLVVAAEVRWGRDIADGWEHDVLGYLLMVVGLVLMMLTDQLLKGLLKPIADEQRWEVAPVRFLRQESLPYRVETLLLRCWNLLFASRFEARTASAEDEVAAAGDPTENEPAVVPVETTNSFMSRRRGRLLLASGLAFMALGTVQGAVLVARGEVRPINADDLLAMIGPDWVAESTAGLKVSNYRETVRETNSDSGQYSRSWTLTDERQREMSWSIDFPFSGWHELSRCYTGQGWTIEERRTCRADDLDYVEVHLSHGMNWYGVLFFALTDPNGQPLPPRSNHWRGWRSRLMTSPTTQWFQQKSDWEVMDEVSIQLQLFSQMRTRLDSELVEERRGQFLDLVESSRRQFREHALVLDSPAVSEESQP